jgi:hypothetical protein
MERLDLDSVIKGITISDGDPTTNRTYNVSSSAEERRASHILITTPKKTSASATVNKTTRLLCGDNGTGLHFAVLRKFAGPWISAQRRGFCRCFAEPFEERVRAAKATSTV